VAEPSTVTRPGRAVLTLPLYRRLARYAARRRLALSGVAVTMLLSTWMHLLTPWPLALVVDSVLGGKPLPAPVQRVFAALPGGTSREDLLTWAVLAQVGVFLLGWALALAASLAGISFGKRLQYDLAADVLAHLQRLSLSYHSRRGAGDLMRRVSVDSGCASTIVHDALLPVGTAVFGLVTMLLVMLRIDPLLTALGLLVLPPLMLGVRRFSAPMAERDYEQQEAEGRIYEMVEESLSGIETVQAFTAETRQTGRFRTGASQALQATLAATRVQFRFKIWTGTVTAVGSALVMYVGGRHALAGQLSVGQIIVFLAYLAGLYTPLETLLYSTSTIQGAAGSATRVLEVLESVPEVADGSGALAVPVRGEVRLAGVGFAYEPGRPVLSDVSVVVRPGELVAVVGPTGAGKSTLAGLLVRFFDPTAGRVLLDGVDARDVPVGVWREQVGVVLQESFLFPLSIHDNIAYGRPGALREQVVAAARAANADEFVSRLPQGYDTVVGERGATLSGGQRQRVAIARALLKDAPVLVLDEPTSALDVQTEGLLLAALDRLMQGRTTLVIAHRLSTVRRADRIVVLDQGRVAETGTHEQLLRRGGLYAHLHALSTGHPAAATGLADLEQAADALVGVRRAEVPATGKPTV